MKTIFIKLRGLLFIASTFVFITSSSCNNEGLEWLITLASQASENNFIRTEILTGTNRGSDANNSQLKASSKSPIRVGFDYGDGYKLLIINYTPVTLSNVNITTSDGEVIRRFHLPAWSKLVFQDINSIAFRNMGATVNIPETENPIMAKFKKIKTSFSWVPHNFNPGNDTNSFWQSFATGESLRNFYIMNYNMAYYLSSDSFEQIMTTNNIILRASLTSLRTYDSPRAIFNFIRDLSRTIKIWIVRPDSGAGGIGGQNEYLGILASILKDYTVLSNWYRNGLTGANTWFHEFGHLLGFGHDSNMASNALGEEYPSIQELVSIAENNNFINNGDILFPPK